MKKLITTKKLIGAFMLLAFVLSPLGVSKALALTTVNVTVLKYIDGSMATAATANNADFQMNASWIVSGSSGSGQFVLSENGYNGSPTPYQVVASGIPVGSSYSTSEVMDGSVVGASCSTSAVTPSFSLVGYTSGNTLAQAIAATPSTVPPSATNLISDKYIIVWNHDCSSLTTNNTVGNLGGTVAGGSTSQGTLAITSVTATQTNGTANNTYANGWSYIFNVTVPANETKLSMKFANWFSSTTSSSIAVANNMRIASLQANNGGTPVTLTAANVYSSPALQMTGDLDPSMPGLQVQVKVDVKIPFGSINGAYTTTYGIQTLP